MLSAACTFLPRSVYKYTGEDRFHTVHSVAKLVKGSIQAQDILAIELHILKELIGDILLIFSPLEIIVNVSRILQLSFYGQIEDILSFCESISNFVYWKTWGEYSLLSIALGTLMVLMEIYNKTDDLVVLVKFFNGNSQLIEELEGIRLFIFANFGEMTDDQDILSVVQQFATYSLLDKLHSNPSGVAIQ